MSLFSIKLKADFYISIVILILCSFLLYFLKGYPSASRQYPLIVIIIVIFLSSVLLLKSILEKVKDNTISELYKTSSNLKRPTISFIICLFYVTLLPFINYFYITPLFLIILMFFLGERSIKKIIIVTSITMIFLYTLFILILNAKMPT